MKPIIFLDIDGVLNSTRWLLHINRSSEPYPRVHIDPVAVAVLDEIAREAGDAEVVISSSWRKLHPFEYMCDALQRNGLEAKIVGVTPDFFALRHERDNKPYVRGDEIQAWLDQNFANNRQFVIFDDDSDMGHLLPRLIRTSGDDGLFWAHIAPALRLLGVKKSHHLPETA